MPVEQPQWDARVHLFDFWPAHGRVRSQRWHYVANRVPIVLTRRTCQLTSLGHQARDVWREQHHLVTSAKLRQGLLEPIRQLCVADLIISSVADPRAKSVPTRLWDTCCSAIPTTAHCCHGSHSGAGPAAAERSRRARQLPDGGHLPVAEL